MRTSYIHTGSYDTRESDLLVRSRWLIFETGHYKDALSKLHALSRGFHPAPVSFYPFLFPHLPSFTSFFIQTAIVRRRCYVCVKRKRTSSPRWMAKGRWSGEGGLRGVILRLLCQLKSRRYKNKKIQFLSAYILTILGRCRSGK